MVSTGVLRGLLHIEGGGGGGGGEGVTKKKLKGKSMYNQ